MLKWRTHADLAIRKTPEVKREECLDHMTFCQKETGLIRAFPLTHQVKGRDSR